MLPSPYPRSNELVMISPEGDSPQPSVRLADYRAWKTNTRPLFSAIAFYLPTIKRVRIAPHRTAELSIIRASASLFELLRLPTCAGDVSQRSGRGPTPQLLLSDSAWRKDFQGDPRIVGRVVEIGGRRVRIAGVLAQDRWRLPGRADGWMLPDNIQDKGQENGQDKGENRGQDDAQLDAMPSSAKGYVLARIRASSFPPGSADRRWMTVYRRNGEEERFECFSLAALERQPASIFLFALLLACLALPATTPLPLGEYPARAERLAWEIRARRWLFLAAKLGLMLPLAYCAALALAYGVVAHGGSSPGGGGPQYVELAAAFLGMLFGFRWALRDQRGRCPVCLRRLTHPARVGEASRNFLAWNGTELICAGGHGLLHIPEIPTSWFGCQRWLYLDPSWSGLFGDAYAASVAVS